MLLGRSDTRQAVDWFDTPLLTSVEISPIACQAIRPIWQRQPSDERADYVTPRLLSRIGSQSQGVPLLTAI